jgi:DNA-binding NarL/FixJ family response regulator
MATGISCVAVDDHASVREGLAFLLDGSSNIDLLQTVPTGEEAVEAVKRNGARVVIMDVRLPGMDGISTAKRLTTEAPDAGVVMFSAYGDRRLLSDAIAAGARGYVLKGSPPEDLVRAIKTVSEGEAFVDPSLSPTLLMNAGVGDGPLSEREREILQLLAEGLHTDEVAERIGLSPETVKSDTRRAISKLEADGRVHAVAIALRQALIE